MMESSLTNNELADLYIQPPQGEATWPRQVRFHQYVRRTVLCGASLFLVLTLHAAAVGQGSTPDRGFHPGGSYALSDIETINTSNGNLMLNLALGKLAPGRGGLFRSSKPALRLQAIRQSDSVLSGLGASNYR